MTQTSTSLSGYMDSKTHIFPVRVYFEDTDTGGVVYHSNYLKYMERARTEMLRCLGYPHEKLMTEDHTMFMVRRCEIDYKGPAKLDQIIKIKTTVTEQKGVRLHLRQEICTDDVSLVLGQLEIVSTDLTGRPKRLPKRFLDIL